MIIDETDNNFGFECKPHASGLAMVVDNQYEIVVDIEQASKLIVILQKFVSGDEIE